MTDNRHQIILEDILKELREITKRLDKMNTITFQMPIQETCEHDYPSVWHGTVPPMCTKCGKPAKNLTGIW